VCSVRPLCYQHPPFNHQYHKTPPPLCPHDKRTHALAHSSPLDEPRLLLVNCQIMLPQEELDYLTALAQQSPNFELALQGEGEGAWVYAGCFRAECAAPANQQQ